MVDPLVCVMESGSSTSGKMQDPLNQRQDSVVHVINQMSNNYSTDESSFEAYNSELLTRVIDLVPELKRFLVLIKKWNRKYNAESWKSSGNRTIINDTNANDGRSDENLIIPDREIIALGVHFCAKTWKKFPSLEDILYRMEEVIIKKHDWCEGKTDRDILELFCDYWTNNKSFTNSNQFDFTRYYVCCRTNALHEIENWKKEMIMNVNLESGKPNMIDHEKLIHFRDFFKEFNSENAKIFLGRCRDFSNKFSTKNTVNSSSTAAKSEEKFIKWWMNHTESNNQYLNNIESNHTVESNEEQKFPEKKRTSKLVWETTETTETTQTSSSKPTQEGFIEMTFEYTDEDTTTLEKKIPALENATIDSKSETLREIMMRKQKFPSQRPPVISYKDILLTPATYVPTPPGAATYDPSSDLNQNPSEKIVTPKTGSSSSTTQSGVTEATFEKRKSVRECIDQQLDDTICSSPVFSPPRTDIVPEKIVPNSYSHARADEQQPFKLTLSKATTVGSNETNADGISTTADGVSPFPSLIRSANDSNCQTSSNSMNDRTANDYSRATNESRIESKETSLSGESVDFSNGNKSVRIVGNKTTLEDTVDRLWNEVDLKRIDMENQDSSGYYHQDGANVKSGINEPYYYMHRSSNESRRYYPEQSAEHSGYYDNGAAGAPLAGAPPGLDCSSNNEFQRHIYQDGDREVYHDGFSGPIYYNYPPPEYRPPEYGHVCYDNRYPQDGHRYAADCAHDQVGYDPSRYDGARYGYHYPSERYHPSVPQYHPREAIYHSHEGYYMTSPTTGGLQERFQERYGDNRLRRGDEYRGDGYRGEPYNNRGGPHDDSYDSSTPNYQNSYGNSNQQINDDYCNPHVSGRNAEFHNRSGDMHRNQVSLNLALSLNPTACLPTAHYSSPRRNKGGHLVDSHVSPHNGQSNLQGMHRQKLNAMHGNSPHGAIIGRNGGFVGAQPFRQKEEIIREERARGERLREEQRARDEKLREQRMREKHGNGHGIQHGNHGNQHLDQSGKDKRQIQKGGEHRDQSGKDKRHSHKGREHRHQNQGDPQHRPQHRRDSQKCPRNSYYENFNSNNSKDTRDNLDVRDTKEPKEVRRNSTDSMKIQKEGSHNQSYPGHSQCIGAYGGGRYSGTSHSASGASQSSRASNPRSRRNSAKEILCFKEKDFLMSSGGRCSSKDSSSAAGTTGSKEVKTPRDRHRVPFLISKNRDTMKLIALKGPTGKRSRGCVLTCLDQKEWRTLRVNARALQLDHDEDTINIGGDSSIIKRDHSPPRLKYRFSVTLKNVTKDSDIRIGVGRWGKRGHRREGSPGTFSSKPCSPKIEMSKIEASPIFVMSGMDDKNADLHDKTRCWGDHAPEDLSASGNELLARGSGWSDSFGSSSSYYGSSSNANDILIAESIHSISSAFSKSPIGSGMPSPGLTSSVLRSPNPDFLTTSALPSPIPGTLNGSRVVSPNNLDSSVVGNLGSSVVVSPNSGDVMVSPKLGSDAGGSEQPASMKKHGKRNLNTAASVTAADTITKSTLIEHVSNEESWENLEGSNPDSLVESMKNFVTLKSPFILPGTGQLLSGTVLHFECTVDSLRLLGTSSLRSNWFIDSTNNAESNRPEPSSSTLITTSNAQAEAAGVRSPDVATRLDGTLINSIGTNENGNPKLLSEFLPESITKLEIASLNKEDIHTPLICLHGPNDEVELSLGGE